MFDKNLFYSISIGGGFSLAIDKLIKTCFKVGIHVVVSAGNNADDACNSSPASTPQAITVGATEKFTNDITDFTNIGSCVDIFAPGRDIIAAGDKKTGLTLISGTSQAAPHVAGTIALIISQKGNMKPSSMIKELINLSVKKIIRGLDAFTPNRFLRVPCR